MMWIYRLVERVFPPHFACVIVVTDETIAHYARYERGVPVILVRNQSAITHDMYERAGAGISAGGALYCAYLWRVQAQSLQCAGCGRGIPTQSPAKYRGVGDHRTRQLDCYKGASCQDL